MKIVHISQVARASSPLPSPNYNLQVTDRNEMSWICLKSRVGQGRWHKTSGLSHRWLFPYGVALLGSSRTSPALSPRQRKWAREHCRVQRVRELSGFRKSFQPPGWGAPVCRGHLPSPLLLSIPCSQVPFASRVWFSRHCTGLPTPGQSSNLLPGFHAHKGQKTTTNCS